MTRARQTAIGARHSWLWRNRFAFGHCSPEVRPRLLVDVSAIIQHDAQTGIQRVVRAVWSELKQRSGTDFDLIPVYASNSHGYCHAPFDFIPGATDLSDALCASAGSGDIFLGLDLSAHLLPKFRRQLRAWRAHGASVNLVVYDLLPLSRPDWFNGRTIRHFRKWYSLLAADADRAICISGHVAGELRQRLQAEAQHRPQVARIRLGADIAASLPSRGVSGDLMQVVEQMRFRPSVLMVGTIEPRKGYEIALRTFERLWERCPAEAPDLVIVGRAGWKTDALQEQIRAHSARGKRLHWLTGVSDEGLCRLYEACRGVFVPSRAEGFGLPVVEAAIARRHVLARDLAVFREQGLSNVTYFDDESPEALAEQLLQLIALPQQAPSPPADLPTWSDCVDDLVAELGVLAPDVSIDKRSLRKAS